MRFTVTLEAGAKDDAGADYKLLIEEDGREVKSVDVPRPTPVEDLSVMLALDTSGSMNERNRMAQAKAAAEVFLQRLPPSAECGLILFDHEIRPPVLDPARDRAAVAKQVREVEPRGGTAYLDATGRGIAILATAATHRERAVVLLTDGVDLNSTTPLAEVVRQAKDNKVRVYTVGIGEPGKQERVNSVLVLDHSGSMKPPGALFCPTATASAGGSGDVGHASCQRISSISRKPTSRKTIAVRAYCRPTTLWSVDISRD